MQYAIYFVLSLAGCSTVSYLLTGTKDCGRMDWSVLKVRWLQFAVNQKIIPICDIKSVEYTFDRFLREEAEGN
jgi:hypothetical protein